MQDSPISLVRRILDDSSLTCRTTRTIPEPSTLLLCIALGVVGAWRRWCVVRRLGTLAVVVAALMSASVRAETLEWTRQLGTSGIDTSNGVSADGLGNVYMSGFTYGSFEGTNAGGEDAFLAKYDASGTLEWTQQFGTSGDDLSKGPSADGLGSVHISGWTNGSLEGPNAGWADAFLAKFTDLLLGDVNLDGEVNGLDIDPFVEVLLSGPYQPEADMNEDEVVNGLDVDPFVAAVVGGSAAQIPEPSTLLLCIIALGVASGWRKWGR